MLVYQSRVFTEQGGNIEMFSANGDLNAGKGPKSSAAYPPLRLICDTDGYCRVNPAGLVTGAGVGALLSVPGQDPDASNVTLTAPHGIIDAAASAKTADVPAQSNKDQPSVIIVEVLRYGGGSVADQPPQDEKRDRGLGRQSYHPNSAFQIIGPGDARP